MSSKSNDGGPAFPTDDDGQIGTITYHHTGMTLRDYFAAKAMAAMVNSIVFPQECEDQLKKAGFRVDEFESFAAMTAYGFADAMLAERERGGAQ